MDQSRWAPKFEELSLEDEDERQTPPGRSAAKLAPERTTQPKSSSQNPNLEASSDEELSGREARLQTELESLQRINAVIEGVTASLQKAKANMSTVNETVSNAHALLDTWTRILSQTEHNQRLILNPAWSGASQDVIDAENETLQREREQERREAEEARKREAVEAQKRQEEERRRLESERRPASVSSVRRGTRGGVAGSRAGLGHRSTASVSTSTKTTTSAVPASKPGRGAISGYGRVGSVGTKAARAKGAGS